MAPGQRAGRRPVEGAADQEGPQRRRPVVRDRARGLVADVPSGLGQPPHQVDVLAAAQRRVEEVGPGRHVGPDDEGRARHEGDAAPRPDRALPGRPGRATSAPPRSVQRADAAGPARCGAPRRPPAGRRSGPAAVRASRRSGRSRSRRRRRARCAPRASPALRAPAGPTLAASPTKRAPWRSAISLVAPASADASSTTMQARPRERAEQPVELARAGRAPARRP